MKVWQRIAHLSRRIANCVMRRGNTMALQEFLSETLARFQSSSGFGGTKCAPASSREFVHYAKHQWQFRTYDGEVGLDLVCELEHGIEFFQVDCDTLGLVSYPAVAGSAVDFPDSRRLP